METKKNVTVAEMARMVGLSRSRFYQLLGTALPFPLYNIATRRPFFNEELQQVCLEVRRRNCGIDGKPIFFYCRGVSTMTPKKKTKNSKPQQHADLIDGLNALGLSATPTQADEAMNCLYPKGVGAASESEVLRRVFLQIKRQYSADNVGK